MYSTTGPGVFTQGLTLALGELRHKAWCKSECKFKKHKAEGIQTEMVHLEGFGAVIDRERKGSRVEYRLDVLGHAVSFDGRSREDVLAQFEKWVESKLNKGEK